MRIQKEKIPDFIIVGTMKSGTSSLMHHLRNHDKIHTPKRELHFFDSEQNYKKGIGWYRKKILRNKNKKAKIFGEKTPTYSYQENVAERIYKDCPETKIVWVFRNPTSRTYSNYFHAYKKGNEPLTFEQAILNEDERLKTDIWKGYRLRSIYHEQVKRFLQYFPKGQMFFILFEDLIKEYSSDHVLNKLFDFLGVNRDEFNYISEPRNKTVMPRFPVLQSIIRKLGLSKFPVVVKAFNIVDSKKLEAGYAKMSTDLKNELNKFFLPHNNELAKIIGKDLSVWDANKQNKTLKN